MIGLVIAVIILHAISLPVAVCVAAEVSADAGSGELTFGICYVPIARKSIDTERLKAAISGDTEEKTAEEDRRNKKKNGVNKFFFFFLKKLFTVLRVRALDINARIGLSDAAVTAVTVGGLRVALFDLCRVLGYRRDTVDITADYDGERLDANFVGIISLCIADIIYAVIAAMIGGLRRPATAKQRG